MIPLKSQAIQTALDGDWTQAISLNQEILKENPDDIETLNRLAFAYTISGDKKEAKALYQKVLQLDPRNPIALKNLNRLKNETDNVSSTVILKPLNTLFLEETGKTKVVELVNVAEQKTIAHLRTGEELTLSVKRLKVFVLDSNKKYIGVLPDNIGKRLIKFLTGGNHYETYVKSVNNNSVSIFVREIKRAARFKNQPSFLSNNEKSLVIEKNNTKIKKNQKPVEDDLEDSSEDSL